MWQTGGRTRTSPDYNCEAANPACQMTLGYPPVAVRLVGGGATSHWRLVRNGLPSSPSLISIRLTAWTWTWITVHAVPPSQGTGGVNTHTHTKSLETTALTSKQLSRCQSHSIATSFLQLQWLAPNNYVIMKLNTWNYLRHNQSGKS